MGSRLSRALVSLALLLVSSQPAGASGSCELRLLGSNRLGPAHAAVVSGTTAFLSAGYDLVALDVSDPTQPVLLGRTDLEFAIVAMDVAGNLLAVAGGETGLVLYDVSDPGTAVEIARQAVETFAWDVTLVPGLALVAEGYGDAGYGRGLLIFDVADPSSPQLVGVQPTGPLGPVDVVARGNLAYASGQGQLYVIDFAQPSAPVQIGFYGSIGYDLAISPSGRRLYGIWEEALFVLDVSDPTAPALVTWFWADRSWEGLALGGGWLYAVDPDLGLRVFDVGTETGPPVLAGGLPGPRSTWDLHASGSLLLSSEGGRGLALLDLSQPAAPVEIGLWATPDDTYGLSVAGDLAYLRTGSALRVLDVSDPGRPTDLGSFATDNHDDWAYQWSPAELLVEGGLAYVPDSSGLRVVDVSNPAQPFEVGSWASQWPARSLARSGDFLYVGIVASPWNQHPSLYALDVSDPAQPVELGFVPGDGWWPTRLVAEGDLLVGTLSWECRTFDLSDPTLPSQVGICDVDSRHDNLELRSDRLFVAGGQRFSIVDVSEPATPAVVGWVGHPWPPFTGIALAGQRAFVTHFEIGVRMIDFHSPAAPFEAGAVETPGLAYRVAYDGGRVYVADGAAGISIYQDCLLFEDGFESGDTSAWSESMP